MPGSACSTAMSAVSRRAAPARDPAERPTLTLRLRDRPATIADRWASARDLGRLRARSPVDRAPIVHHRGAAPGLGTSGSAGDAAAGVLGLEAVGASRMQSSVRAACSRTRRSGTTVRKFSVRCNGLRRRRAALAGVAARCRPGGTGRSTASGRRRRTVGPRRSAVSGSSYHSTSRCRAGTRRCSTAISIWRGSVSWNSSISTRS